MEPPESVRIDKWLWAVRLYKTRSMAANACTAGKVHINEQAVKPSRSVRVGDMIIAVTGEITRTVKVLQLLQHRVAAKLVPGFMEDLTPTAELEKPREKNLTPFVFRAKGEGRPTKKDRRRIDDMFS